MQKKKSIFFSLPSRSSDILDVLLGKFWEMAKNASQVAKLIFLLAELLLLLAELYEIVRHL
ncbi:MAG: hypothetical protein MR971_01130 [Bacteroidales bacterium]|nr:hypothetical protein [Bacteroidales bacterium]